MDAVGLDVEPDLDAIGVDDVVELALADKPLRRSAAKVRLRPEQIAAAVRANAVDLAYAGQVDTRGRFDNALRRTRAAATSLERMPPWPRWPRALIVFAVLLGTTVFSALALRGETIPTAGLWGLVAVAPFAGFSIALVFGRARRRSRLAREARIAEHELRDARAALQKELADTFVRPLIRREINARSGASYDTKTGAVDSEGLAEILDPRYLVTTAATRRLDRLLADMPGGSIGLSGPRGSGKSSLIQARCPSGDDQPEGLLGVVVSAPVDFEAREFVLHLFSELCMAVLGRDAVERLRNPRPLARRASASTGALVGSVLIALVGIAVLVDEVLGRPSNVELGLLATTAGTVGAVALAVLRNLDSRISLGTWGTRLVPNARFSAGTRATAERQLRAIWFQQTFSEGWSGALKLPGGLQGGLETGQELARQQMSMPDIVSELRQLIGEITAKEDVRVRIGIDELDKIASAEDAARFFNEIKVLFGINDCFFLVSVSEDALASFEQRGMPARDVFDSSFDDVVRLDYLHAVQSIAMLRERVVGLPVPFLLLCHCISGGLPRDLIRTARALVSLLPVQGQTNLTKVTQGLVADQIAAKAAGVAMAARRLLPPGDAVMVQELADRLATRSVEVKGLIPFIEDAAEQVDALAHRSQSDTETRAALVAYGAELVAYAYYCVTILALFRTEVPNRYFSRTLYLEHTASGGGPDIVVNQLARARQAFAVHPRAAWMLIAAAQPAAGLGAALDYPFSALEIVGDSSRDVAESLAEAQRSGRSG